MKFKIPKKIQFTLIYFVPVFLIFVLFSFFIFNSYSEKIHYIDELISEIAFDLDGEEMFPEGLDDIISPEEWEYLSQADIDKKLTENGQQPIGDPRDPFYNLTPEEIENTFGDNHPIFLEPIDEDYEQASYFSLEQLEQIQDDIDSSTKNILFVLLLIITLFFGVLAHMLARKSLQPLEEALEKQKRFVSDSSHELRTPLALIKSEAEVLLRDKNASLEDFKKFTKTPKLYESG